ncbi:hypothetical protein GGR54DRAFT_539219 [Hypoxylon sp. NC1633]|nr:hypothetical protein GGR54DRAFT_539219 [Hypoxylon sp. NC1633]
MAPTGGQRLPTSGLNTNVDRNANTTTTTDWQFAASNSTLNTWFGGRQPSWLTNSKPVKPTPRPSQPPKQLPIDKETASSVVGATQLALSAAPVPVLVPDPVAVPSPNPVSVQVPPVSATTASSSSTPTPPRQLPRPRSIHQTRSAECPRRPIIQTQTSTSTQTLDTVLPSPAPSDEPSPGIADPQSLPAVTEARFVLDTTLDDRRGGQKQVRNRVSAVRPRTGSRHGKGVSASPRTPRAAKIALNTPPTPNMNIPPAGPNMASQQQSQGPPAKRRCVVVSPSHQYLESINATQTIHCQIHACGGGQNLNNHLERPRYQLLLDACEEGDLFFVALHQLFCTWTTNQVTIHRMCQVDHHNPQLIDVAFGTMGTILKSNSGLCAEHLTWFMQFPVPFPQVLNNQVYHQVVKQVFNFLMCVAQKWSLVHTEHQAKGYPLLMVELLGIFRLYSPILQTIMFRASRRSLGIPDGYTSNDVEALFKSDQQAHRNPDGSFTARIQSPEYQEYNNSLIRQYQAMIAQGQSRSNVQQGVQHGVQHQTPRPGVHPGSPQLSQQQMQSPGLYHPQMNPQIPPQMQQPNPGLTAMPRPTPVLQSGNPSSNGRTQMEAPLNSPMGMPSPALMNDGSFPFVPPPPQFTVPSSHSGHNGSMNMNSSRSTSFPSGSVDYGRQAQFNQPNSQAPLQPPQFLQQQPVYRQSAHGPPAARPQSTPNTTRPSYPSYPEPAQPAQPTGHYPRDYHYQSSVGQPGQPPQRTSSFGGQPSYDRNFASGNRVHAPGLNPDTGQMAPLKHDDQFVPPPGARIGLQDYPGTPHDKRSIYVALHQAHLRSPKRIHSGIGSTAAERHYQAVKYFALSPVPISPRPHMYEFKFRVTEQEHGKVYQDETMPGHALPVNVFTSGTLRFRVRCCFRKKTSAQLQYPESEWVMTNTTWPEHIFMEINGFSLSAMRKSHFSRDLPVDASPFISKGVNHLCVTVMPGREPEGQTPCLAVEVVEVLCHSAVVEMVKTHRGIPGVTTREVVKSRLGRSSGKNADNDDLAMLDYLSIDLADPFSSRLVDIPVRSETCRHLECFDLETWLNTRLGKPCQCKNMSSTCPDCPKEPSFVDKWKCPLCNKDARPYSLRIDHFLVKVLSEMRSQGNLRAKSILVTSDGSWKVKEEAGDDDSDDNSDEDDGGPAVKSSRSATASFQRERSQVERSQIEIIELDDD